MIWAKTLKKNIFCLEGDWDKDLTQKCGIIHILEYIKMNFGVDVIHRHCTTEDSFEYYIKEYNLPKYKDYNVLYLAFHGFPNQLMVGDTFVELEDFADMCEDSLRGKIVYFGSCLTLNIDKRKIKSFLKKTKALAVFGYMDSIDFTTSTALDLLMMEVLQEHKDMRKVENIIKTKYSQLAKQLKFRMVY